MTARADDSAGAAIPDDVLRSKREKCWSRPRASSGVKTGYASLDVADCQIATPCMALGSADRDRHESPRVRPPRGQRVPRGGPIVPRRSRRRRKLLGERLELPARSSHRRHPSSDLFPTHAACDGIRIDPLKRLCVGAKMSGSRVHNGRIAAVCLNHRVTEPWTAEKDFAAFPGLKTLKPLIGR